MKVTLVYDREKKIPALTFIPETKLDETIILDAMGKLNASPVTSKDLLTFLLDVWTFRSVVKVRFQ